MEPIHLTIEDVEKYYREKYSPTKLLGGITEQDYRYIIYARKSTDSEDKQERSIADQIDECKRHARERGLHLVSDTVIEEKSAKRSGNRPLFRKMLSDIKAGKVDAILTWAPDRLSRNMKEAGEIIDMLDTGELKSLAFVSQSFSNDKSDKMMLGIQFVMAKEYSEKLGIDTDRGTRKSFLDGEAIGKAKLGYKIVNKRYKPNMPSWSMLRQAFEMFLEGSSTKQCAQFLNDRGITKCEIDEYGNEVQLPLRITAKGFNELVKRPFYSGVNVYGVQTRKVDIVLLGEGFTPLITPSEHFAILDRFNKGQGRKSNTPKESQVNALLGILCCGHCNQPLTEYITKKRLKDKGTIYNYLYVECRNDECPHRKTRNNSRYRARFTQLWESVLEQVKDDIKPNGVLSQAYIELRLKDLQQSIGQKLTYFKTKRAQLNREASGLKSKILEQQEKAESANTLEEQKFHKAKANSLRHKMKEVDMQLQKMKETDSKLQSYLNNPTEVVENWQLALQNTENIRDIAQINEIGFSMWSRIYCKGKSVVNYTLKEPLAELIKEKGGLVALRRIELRLQE